MSKYKITGIIYIHTGMNEWNLIHENFHTKHSAFTTPDEHMACIIQLHIMSIQPANKASDPFMWLVSGKKTEAVRETQRDRERHSERQRQRNRQRQWERETEKERDTDRQRDRERREREGERGRERESGERERTRTRTLYFTRIVV